jgi:hypothetical protein
MTGRGGQQPEPFAGRGMWVMASIRELAAQRRDEACREAERRLGQRIGGVRIVPRRMRALRLLARIHREEPAATREERTAQAPIDRCSVGVAAIIAGSSRPRPGPR